MGNITRNQARMNRDHISRLITKGLSHQEIIDQLQIDRSTFYRYLKQIHETEVKVWNKVDIDSARYRALALLRSFEDTARVCTNIINDSRTSNKDRIEACKARDMANAHIFRLVHEGTMFQHLPELKVYSSMIPSRPDTNDNNEPQLEYQDNNSNSIDTDSISNSTVEDKGKD